MNCLALTEQQRDALRWIAALEGQTMAASELEDFLKSLGDPFDENGWDYTSQADEYSEGCDEGTVVTEILSDDEVELPDPYVCKDGRICHCDGSKLYEIWMSFACDDGYDPEPDTLVTIDEVDIAIPDELWR